MDIIEKDAPRPVAAKVAAQTPLSEGVDAPTPAPPVQRQLPSTDLAGMLNHLIEKYSQPEHPAKAEIAWVGTESPDIKITFTYETPAATPGKWKRIKRMVVGMNIDDAAGNLAGALSAPVNA